MEDQYLDLVRKILQDGERRENRTGMDVIGLFAPRTLTFSEFPLLTTRRVSLRLVFEELMWMLRGQTDGKILKNKNVKIWSGNGSRQYLDQIGLSGRRVDDLGPIYGFQWRHFGAYYTHCDDAYDGVDQLRSVLRKILYDPNSRRIIMTAWNPADLAKMALPPCHTFCQFYVSKKKLSLQLYQRSCDVGLGLPFNMASYALLLRLVCWTVDLEVGEFSHVLGDTHIYLDHLEYLEKLVHRVPKKFPVLRVKKPRGERGNLDECLKALVSLEFEDVELVGYDPFSSFQMKMAV